VRLIDNAYQLLVRNSTKVDDFELLKTKPCSCAPAQAPATAACCWATSAACPAA